MTIRAYSVPRNDGEDLHDYFNRVTSLPLTFEGDHRGVSATGDGYVEIDGSIDGVPEVPVRPKPDEAA